MSKTPLHRRSDRADRRPAPAARLLGAFVAGAILALAALSPSGAAAQETPAEKRERPDTLTVMTYNVLYATPDEGTVRAIRAADPDIVGLQEVSEPRLRHIARELGYYYHHNGDHEASFEQDTGLLSRYPISRPTRYGATIYLTVDDPIHVFNVHLTPYPYEPYRLRDDSMNVEEAVASARFSRFPEIQPVLEAMQDPLESGAPVFLVGDFNEPSHLDWTEAAAEAGLHLGLSVEWPTSKAITRHGLTDAWREVHPDETERPAPTWTTLDDDPDEVHDRIDIIYFDGDSVEALDAFTLGHDENEPATDRAVEGYPSDHRSVVGVFGL
jgi:endonuclease/exonuclease/phosphatase family metal-dependent hydrolase